MASYFHDLLFISPLVIQPCCSSGSERMVCAVARNSRLFTHCCYSISKGTMSNGSFGEPTCFGWVWKGLKIEGTFGTIRIPLSGPSISTMLCEF